MCRQSLIRVSLFYCPSLFKLHRDRKIPLNQQQTLTGEVLRWMNSISFPSMKDAVSELLFQACDENGKM